MNDMTGVVLDQKDYSSPSDLVPLLQNKVAANPLVRVLIRADREVKYDFVRQVLQAVGQSGIGNVTFSVVDKEASPSTPS
jgi:biopolymer transport protein ExbD